MKLNRTLVPWLCREMGTADPEKMYIHNNYINFLYTLIKCKQTTTVSASKKLFHSYVEAFIWL